MKTRVQQLLCASSIHGMLATMISRRELWDPAALAAFRCSVHR